MSFPCPHCHMDVDPSATDCHGCNTALEPTLSPSHRIADRYLILDVLTSGPLGATYLARDLVRKTDISLLILSDELCPTPEERAAFRSRIERVLAKPLSGCALPYECFADGNRICLTFPWVEGVSLRSVIHARNAVGKPITVEECLRVYQGLIVALRSLHTQSPHGAIFPENLCLTPNGLVLLYCGVVPSLPPARWIARLGRFVRTRESLAPETMIPRPVAAVSDLFAVGIVVTELLTNATDTQALQRTGVQSTIQSALIQLCHREVVKRTSGLSALSDALTKAAGLSQKPADPSTFIPKIEANTIVQTAGKVAEPESVPAPEQSEPYTSEKTNVIPAETKNTDTTTIVSAPAKLPSMTAGRLSPKTPAMPPRLGVSRSGPPGGLESVRSGPPIPQPVKPTQQKPAVSNQPLPSILQPPGAKEDFIVVTRSGRVKNLEGIDPRLIRAAKKLEQEKPTTAEHHIDDHEVETIDE